MHLSQSDKKATKDGFKFLVLSPSGVRKCYCTTVAEAKSEAGKGGKIVSLGQMRYTTQNPTARMVGLQRNPAKGTVKVARADRKGQPITDESFYFEKAGPFARTCLIEKGWTPQTVKDDYDAHVITHLPTGASIYKGGFSLYDNRKKNAVQAMKDLRQWLKKLSAVEVQEISEGFTFGSRKLTPTQDKLLREAYAVCSSGKIERNPTARMVGLQRNPAKQPLPAILQKAKGMGWTKARGHYRNISEDGEFQLHLSPDKRAGKWDVYVDEDRGSGWYLEEGLTFEAAAKRANQYMAKHGTGGPAIRFVENPSAAESGGSVKKTTNAYGQSGWLVYDHKGNRVGYYASKKVALEMLAYANAKRSNPTARMVGLQRN